MFQVNHPGIHLKELRKITKDTGQNSCFSGQDMKHLPTQIQVTCATIILI